MLRLAAFTAAFAAANAATTCLTENSDWGPSCADAVSEAGPFAELCLYIDSNEDEAAQQGCIPEMYLPKNAEGSYVLEAACSYNKEVCWCVTDNCNTKEWFDEFRASYTPPPQCYAGVGGANVGPSCQESKVYKDNKVEHVNCAMRSLSNMCVENNEGGMGDGCPTDDDGNPRDTEEDCTAYRAGDRDADSSFDGTTNHCRWMPTKTDDEKSDSCEADTECKFYADRGEEISGVKQGSCETSDSGNAKIEAWDEKRGTECEMRMKSGCFENNDWMGETEDCTNQETSEGCGSVTELHGSKCMEWTGTEEKEKDCCKWIPVPADPAEACATKGEGTLEGVCEYSDGQGPPSPNTAAAGFEHGMFTLNADFSSKCALVATFRDGKGSAVAFGADTADLVGYNCRVRAGGWESLAEHVGHDEDSIAEYCENFLPEASAMAAFETHSPSEIIAAAKSGQFATLFPGLEDALFLVTSKPEYGECLFTAVSGSFGAAICTCNTAECNDQEALQYISDSDVGPMRLLQFIDGSLLGMRSAINAVVDGLITADGKLNIDMVGAVTEADIDSLMQVSGMSDLTNKEELLTLIEDYQELNVLIAQGPVDANPDIVALFNTTTSANAVTASLATAVAAAAIALF